MPQIGIEYVTMEIGNHTIKGWSDDSDALMMPEEWEGFTTKRGADGVLLAIRNGVRGGEVSIKLLPGTAIAKMLQKEIGIAAHTSTLVLWQGRIADSSTGFTWYLYNGILIKGPLGQTYGKEDAANKVFTFDFEEIIQIPGSANIDPVRMDVPGMASRNVIADRLVDEYNE